MAKSMESKVLLRLENALAKLIGEQHRAQARTEQLASALAKSRQEMEVLKAANHRCKTERIQTRKALDGIIKRFDGIANKADSARVNGGRTSGDSADGQEGI